jgi:dinuclear metal center YbgI/SA1388 family protein
VQLSTLSAWLDDFLRVREIPDDALAFNGLQVGNAGEVTRVAVAVDACLAVFESAAALGADLLIVHHGLFWGGLEPLVGRAYRRVETLIRSGIALYGAHLPLDVHPEVGNNPVLAGLLELPVRGAWGEYKGVPIGVWGEAEQPRSALANRIEQVLGAPARLLATGPEQVRRIGIVTGAGGSMIADAQAAGLDTLVTGEGKHHSYFDAEELGVNVFYAGHYATETVGVQALAKRLEREFALPWTFIDHPTGL